MRKLLIVLILCAKPLLAADLTGNFELAASIGRVSAPFIKNTFFDVGAPIGMVSIDPVNPPILSH